MERDDDYVPQKRRSRIRIQTHRNLFAVEILDVDRRRIAAGYGGLDLDVNPGRYIVRCEVGGPSVDKLIAVKAGQEMDVTFTREEIYRMPSAAPVPGSVSRHEFFTYRASELAVSKADATLGSGSRLVLFASRFEEAEHPTFDAKRGVSFEEVRLLDEAGRALLSFPSASSRSSEDVRYGRVGLAIDLSPGGYYLRWPSPDSPDDYQMQPVWMSPGWITFVFASALGDSETPRPQTVSVHMALLGTEVSAYDDETAEINALAELALASLRTGRRQLGDREIRRIVRAKFQNPMLGILGSYVLLAEDNRNSSLLGILNSHLHELVADHPDVRAIDLLVRTPGEPLDTAAFDFPPMLAQGLQSLDRLEWSETPKQNNARGPLLKGAARLARLRALAESPWTTFWHGSPQINEIGPLSSGIQTIKLDDLVQLLRDTDRFPTWVTPDNVLRSGSYIGGGGETPFGRAEVDATLEANASLARYLAQLRAGSGGLWFRQPKTQHLSWTGLSPRTADLTVTAMAANSVLQSDRFQPI